MWLHFSQRERNVTDKEHIGVDWDKAVEDAIDADLTRLVVIAQKWKEKAGRCGCLNCRKKAEAYEDEKTEAIYWWFADWQE